MFRKLLKSPLHALSYLPTLAVFAVIGVIAYEGHRNEWSWSEKKDSEKKDGDKPSEGESDADATEIPVDSGADYGRSAFDSTLPITHNPEDCPFLGKFLELKGGEVGRRAGIYTGTVREVKFGQKLNVTGTVEFDPTLIARVSPRASGSIFKVYKNVGDRVEPGELLAVVDAAQVGTAKAAFYQAKVQLDLKKQLRSRLQVGVSPERTIIEAESALREAQVTMTTTYQALLNLGFKFNLARTEKLNDTELAQELQFLGLDYIPNESTNNLLPVRNPLEKESFVLQRDAVMGEAVTALQPIFVVGDTTRMVLMLDIRQEDIGLVKSNQQVRFALDGGDAKPREGKIDWIASEIDPKTRTLKVRAYVDNRDGRLKSKTFINARIVVGDEETRLAVPQEALQWEGCSHVVFVREDGGFQVRRVRPGLRHDGFIEVQPRLSARLDPTCLFSKDGFVEILPGLAAGETIVTIGSHVLKSELFKDRLGSAEE